MKQRLTANSLFSKKRIICRRLHSFWFRGIRLHFCQSLPQLLSRWRGLEENSPISHWQAGSLRASWWESPTCSEYWKRDVQWVPEAIGMTKSPTEPLSFHTSPIYPPSCPTPILAFKILSLRYNSPTDGEIWKRFKEDPIYTICSSIPLHQWGYSALLDPTNLGLSSFCSLLGYCLSH